MSTERRSQLMGDVWRSNLVCKIILKATPVGSLIAASLLAVSYGVGLSFRDPESQAPPQAAPVRNVVL
jgi:hypothetical protein